MTLVTLKQSSPNTFQSHKKAHIYNSSSFEVGGTVCQLFPVYFMSVVVQTEQKWLAGQDVGNIFHCDFVRAGAF